MYDREPSFMQIIPPEILLEILIRLPTKDIGRWRCVSKSWRHILSELGFIRAHLTRSKHFIDDQLLMLCEYNTPFTGIVPRNLFGEITVVATQLNFAVIPGSWICQPIFCDGLVLFTEAGPDGTGNSLLVNPTIKEVLELHVPSHDFDSNSGSTRYGFGYDHVNDDYKVVALSCYFLEHEMKMFTDVYSVRNVTWKQVDSSPCFYSTSGFFVSGSVHWIAKNYLDNSRFIAGFDLTEEKLWKIAAPCAIYGNYCEYHDLILLGGCLCVCTLFTIDGVSIWVMKEYGVVESWTKFLIVAEQDLKVTPFIGVSGRLELLMLKDGDTPDKRFVVYNLDTAKFQDMRIEGIKDLFGLSEGFRESLVSPYYNHPTNGKFSLKTQGIRHSGVTDTISSHNKPIFSLSALLFMWSPFSTNFFSINFISQNIRLSNPPVFSKTNCQLTGAECAS